MKKIRFGKICFEKISRKNRKHFQVDITSSDLNEFLIGQKILEAETFLLNLSTTFKGFRTLPGQQTKNSGPANFFPQPGIRSCSAWIRGSLAEPI